MLQQNAHNKLLLRLSIMGDSLLQIKKHFHRAVIVGRRFPICMVHMRDSVTEVIYYYIPLTWLNVKPVSLGSFIIATPYDHETGLQFSNRG